MWSDVKRILAVFCSLSLIGLMSNCAEPRPPQGGPKDTRPPALHPKKYSSPNKSVNYQERQVILTFDEWIKLQSAQSQLVISPPLQNKPEIKIKNKSLVLKWKGLLKDSTTYTIAFGDAVRDITENNSVKNLKFVFSTGPYLDSLSCKGILVDANDGKALEGVLVMLYKNLNDSVPLLQKPYYFSETAADGTFNIDNIGEGSYKVFALKDMNSDYLYNLPNEQIAFLDSVFVLNDTTNGFFRLRLFQERSKPFVLNAKQVGQGCVQLQFNRALVGRTAIQFMGEELPVLALEQGDDSLRLWFDASVLQADDWQFIIRNQEEQWQDTLSVDATLNYEKAVRWCFRNKQNGEDVFDGYRNNKDTLAVQQSPFEAIELNFNNPLEQVDLTKWELYIDSNLLVSRYIVNSTLDSLRGLTIVDTVLENILVDTFLRIQIDSLVRDTKRSTAIHLYAPLSEKNQYKLMLLDSAIQDVFGQHNKDSLEGLYRINNKDQYGRIECLINQADSIKQYLAQLVGPNGVVLFEHALKDSSSYRLVYPYIGMGNYTIAVTEDINRNAMWDPGGYQLKRQAELKIISKNIALKPGWENFMSIDLKSR